MAMTAISSPEIRRGSQRAFWSPVPPKASEKPTHKLTPDDAQASFNAQRRDSSQATNIQGGSVVKRANVPQP